MQVPQQEDKSAMSVLLGENLLQVWDVWLAQRPRLPARERVLPPSGVVSKQNPKEAGKNSRNGIAFAGEPPSQPLRATVPEQEEEADGGGG